MDVGYSCFKCPYRFFVWNSTSDSDSMDFFCIIMVKFDLGRIVMKKTLFEKVMDIRARNLKKVIDKILSFEKKNKKRR